MKVSELIERTDYKLIKGNTDSEVTGISFDNRKVQEGNAFVCIKGVLFDTHEVIRDIAEAGPSVIVVDEKWASSKSSAEIDEIPANIISVQDTREAKAFIASSWYGNPSEKMTVIGVTGSKGKTTTTHMIWNMLKEAGYNAGMVGTAGGYIGDEEYHFGTTTPDSDKLQEFLSKMVEAGCQYAVVEASSQGLKLHRTDAIDFDYGLFLNIEKGDHISPTEHKDFDEYLDCKRKLLRQSRTAILNADDEHAQEMLEGVSGKVITYGESENADYRISNIREESEDNEPCVIFDMNDLTYIIGMPGVFNVGNAAAAVTVASELGVSCESMCDALRNIKVPGRLDMIYKSDALSVCIDYAHNGLSTRNLLKALKAYNPKRIVCVFGCGGNRDLDRRPEMGEASGELADLSIITTEHNRFENFDDILKGIMEGMNRTSGKYEIIEDRKEAIKHAIVDSEYGDLVTIIGIGNDGHQHDHGRDIPHDDISFSKLMIELWKRHQ